MTTEEQQEAMWAAYARRDYDEMLRLALALGPGRDHGLRSLAEDHVQRRKTRLQAEADARTLPPTHPRGLVARARLLLLDLPADSPAPPIHHRALTEALGHLRGALAVDPGNLDALVLLVGVHAQLGDVAAARAASRSIAERAPTARNLLRAALYTPDRFEAFLLVSAACDRGGERPTVAERLDDLGGTADPLADAIAVAALERLGELAEQDPHAASLWARRLLRSGCAEQALAVLWPFESHSRCRRALGDALRALGRDDEADALDAAPDPG